MSTTTGHALSLCMPSVRPRADAETSIRSGWSYARERGAQFVVSDNSRDPAKDALLTELESEGLTCVHQAPAGESDNWRSAFDASGGTWVGFLSDDDLLLPLPGGQQHLEDHPDIAGYKPDIVINSAGYGITDVLNFQVEAESATERVMQYLRRNQGKNCALFSFFRRSLLGELVELVNGHHPTRAGHTDWSTVLALVSTGKLLSDKSTLLVYNNTNWTTQEQVDASNRRIFTKVGLSERSRHFVSLFMGLDSFILIARSTSPVERAERLQAGTLAMHLMFQQLAKVADRSEMSPKESLAVDMLGAGDNLKTMLRDGIKLVELHCPELVERYQAFYRASLELSWGSY